MKEKCIIEEEEVSQTGSQTGDCGKNENEAEARGDCGTVVFTICGKDIVPKDTVVNIDKNNKITHFVDYIPVNM